MPAALLLTFCGGGDIKLPQKAWHVTTLAGSNASGHADGIGTAATFSFPFAIEQIGTTLYVTDLGRNNIRTIDINTARVGTIVIANSSSGHAVGDGTTARFNRPRGVVASASGTLYVADLDNSHRIRAIDLASANKTVSTIAGSEVPGHADGAAGNTAKFKRPCGLAVSGTTLYVVDSNNYRIRAIDLASANKTVRTIAGDGTEKSTNGIGTSAQFKLPSGIMVSGDGDTLYVATEGPQIRKLVYR